MEHRIRSAAIIVRDNVMLFVNHKHQMSGAEVWIPPGGGLEDGESIYDCACGKRLRKQACCKIR